MGYLSDRPYFWRRRLLLHPASKKLIEFGLVGLVIAGALIASFEFELSTVLPTRGILQIAVTDAPPIVDLAGLSHAPMCHGNCTASSVNVTITSIEVHTSGINNMTGSWVPVPMKQASITLDLVKLRNLTQIIASANIQPATITNVRMTVTTITANINGVGIRTLNLPSGKLEVPISPLGDVRAGKTTTIIVDFVPHIACQGNGDCKLTPVLQTTVKRGD